MTSQAAKVCELLRMMEAEVIAKVTFGQGLEESETLVSSLQHLVKSLAYTKLVSITRSFGNTEKAKLRWISGGVEQVSSVTIRTITRDDGNLDVRLGPWPQELIPVSWIRGPFSIELFPERRITLPGLDDTSNVGSEIWQDEETLVSLGETTDTDDDEALERISRRKVSIEWPADSPAHVTVQADRLDGPFFVVISGQWDEEATIDVVCVADYDQEKQLWYGTLERMRPHHRRAASVKLQPMQQADVAKLAAKRESNDLSDVMAFLAEQDLDINLKCVKTEGSEVVIPAVSPLDFRGFGQSGIQVLEGRDPSRNKHAGATKESKEIDGFILDFVLSQKHLNTHDEKSSRNESEAFGELAIKLVPWLTRIFRSRVRKGDVEECVWKNLGDLFRYKKKLVQHPNPPAFVRTAIRWTLCNYRRRISREQMAAIADEEAIPLKSYVTEGDFSSVDVQELLGTYCTRLKPLEADYWMRLASGEKPNQIVSALNLTKQQYKELRLRVERKLATMLAVDILGCMLDGLVDVRKRIYLSEEERRFIELRSIAKFDYATIERTLELEAGDRKKLESAANAKVHSMIAFIELRKEALVTWEDMDTYLGWLDGINTPIEDYAASKLPDLELGYSRRLARRLHGQTLICQDGRNGPLYESGKKYTRVRIILEQSDAEAIKAANSSRYSHARDVRELVLEVWVTTETIVPVSLRDLSYLDCIQFPRSLTR
jgi:DNA-directed RNA polymerase specialized sigma24 family protein